MLLAAVLTWHYIDVESYWDELAFVVHLELVVAAYSFVAARPGVEAFAVAASAAEVVILARFSAVLALAEVPAAVLVAATRRLNWQRLVRIFVAG